MSEYLVKIFLILFICSGLLSLVGGVYLKVHSAKSSSNPTKVRALAHKYLLRGFTTELLSLLAYTLVIKGLLAPGLVLIMLVALFLCIEFIIVRALNLNVPVSRR